MMRLLLASVTVTVTVTVATSSARVHAADPPRGPTSVVDATMSELSAESAAMAAPADDIGRELVEARRTWRAVAIELLRASATEPWASQAAFVTGMRMADMRRTIDDALARALARPRGDADVMRLAAAARAFTERGPAAVHGMPADDPARIDAAVSTSLDGLADALAPFDADGPAAARLDADLWPSADGGAGSTVSVERLAVALRQVPPSSPWVGRATAGASTLRDVASIAAFRPEVEAMADAALGTISLLRSLDGVTWLDEATIGSLRTACETALASMDRPPERRAVATELVRLATLGRLLDDLAVLCAGRGGRPPLGVDGAARCVQLVIDGDRAAERTRAAAALARIMRVQADALPGSLPSLMGGILRRSSTQRTSLVQWMADGAGSDPPAGAMASAEHAADDITLLDQAGTTIGRAATLGTRAQQASLRSVERAGDGLRLDRTRDAARTELSALARRLTRWIELPGERDLRAPQSAVAAVVGPMASRLSARIDRARAQWAASLGRPAQTGVREMEALERVMVQAERLAALGLDETAMLSTSATLARWAAWSPSAQGVAITIAPLRPRISLACAAAAEGQWDECERMLEATDRELPLAEFVSMVNGRLGAALPHQAPGASAVIRSIGTPLHEGSWLAADRARLATLARAWREVRHATSTGADDQAQSCAAVATQVARDLIDSLSAIGPDTVTP